MDDEKAVAEFTAMYDAYRMRVWGYVRARAGRQAADEVVSDTFAVAWRRFHDIPDPALPWLLGVARNVLRETVRASIRRESLAAELRTWARPAAAVSADLSEAVTSRLTLLGALASLSEDDREALILVAWLELTPREAALVTGAAPTAMRVRLHRARKRMQQALAGDDSAASRDPGAPAGPGSPGGPAWPSEPPLPVIRPGR
ncbi:MAG TPA: sigma-70 family RNA polymerase sigma factor [Streptosporangiaceae bacterium]